MEEREIDAYIARRGAGEARRGRRRRRRRAAAMRERIKAAGNQPNREESKLPEPAFGQIKQARGFVSSPLARRREGRDEVGPRLPRPLIEARPGADAV